MTKITRDSSVEELTAEYPGVAGFLVEVGLPCVVCGEPFWGTLAELANQKGRAAAAVDNLMDRIRSRFA